MGIDLLFTNGNILPMTGPKARATTLAVERDRIVYVGNRVPAGIAEAAQTTIDLAGQTLCPGFIDTHAHFTQLGLKGLGLDLTSAGSHEELADALSSFRASHPKRRLLIGFAMSRHSLPEQRLPRADEIDSWVSDRAVILVGRDGRSAVLNTAAQRVIERSEQQADSDGRLSGGALYGAVPSLIDHVGQKHVLASWVAASNMALSLGITSMHTLEGAGALSNREVRDVLRLRRALPLHLVPFFQTIDSSKAAQLGFRHVGGCAATSLDGDLHDRSAALDEDYVHKGDPGRGKLRHEPDRINAFALDGHRRGMQVALHAVGERAIEMAIQAFENAMRRAPRTDLRHRIEHCTLPTPEQIRRISDLGLAVAVQPFALHPSDPSLQPIRTLLGEERFARFMPLRSLVNAGVLLGGGSNAPFLPLDPIRAIAAACQHPNPDESLTPYQALAMYTADAARLAFEEGDRGMLTPGRLADMVVLDRNPLELAPDALEQVQIQASYVGGNKFKPIRLSRSKFMWRAFVGKMRDATRLNR